MVGLLCSFGYLWGSFGKWIFRKIDEYGLVIKTGGNRFTQLLHCRRRHAVCSHVLSAYSHAQEQVALNMLGASNGIRGPDIAWGHAVNTRTFL